VDLRLWIATHDTPSQDGHKWESLKLIFKRLQRGLPDPG